MFRILCFVMMVAATLMLAPDAFAKKGKGHHHHGRGHGHVHWDHKSDWDRGRVNWKAPLRGRWHGGRLYGYGEGGCWRRALGGYVFICR
jgi:hypothetical protein